MVWHTNFKLCIATATSAILRSPLMHMVTGRRQYEVYCDSGPQPESVRFSPNPTLAKTAQSGSLQFELRLFHIPVQDYRRYTFCPGYYDNSIAHLRNRN